MSNLSKYIKSKSNRFKNRKMAFKAIHIKGFNRTTSLCIAAALLVGGFMGIGNFQPEQRSLSIGHRDEESVSVDMKKETLAVVQAAEVAREEGAATGMIINAKAGILMDAGSGAVLFSQNENAKLPPASVTKIMTMLLALEAVDRGQASLSDMVTVSERAASMGGSQMYMEQGEQHPLSQMMEGIAMVSANDACVATAEYICGSVEIFVENMNKRAAELAMNNTHFVNTNGLPVADHYTSAYDIATMSRELLKYSKDQPWFTTWQSTITVGLPGKQKEFGLTNTNRLIKQYTGAIGLKTGFTNEAGYCLSGVAKRGNMTLIAVVLGAENTKIRFAEIAKMLDYGFATYDTVKLAQRGQNTGTVDVNKGSPQTINIVSKEEVAILVKKGEGEKVTMKIELGENIAAPIKKGEKVGEIVAYQSEEEIGRYPLVAEENVDKATILQLYTRMMKKIVT